MHNVSFTQSSLVAVLLINFLQYLVDWRLRPLAIIVKLWAQYHNINDARNSTISSYSLVLMVIHFLQYALSKPVLPCLHKMYPDKFVTAHDIMTIDMMETLDTDYKSENKQPLGELLLRFLDYYSNFE
jgi:poly(A) RNA polymerase GLD2